MIENAKDRSHYVFFHYNSDIQDTFNKLICGEQPYYNIVVPNQWDFQITFGCHFVIGKESAYFLPDERPEITIRLYNECLSINDTYFSFYDCIAYDKFYNLVAGVYSSRQEENNGYYNHVKADRLEEDGFGRNICVSVIQQNNAIA